MVQQHDREHGLGDRGGTQTHTGIVAAGGAHLRGLAAGIDGIPGDDDARGRLQRHAGADRLATGDAALNPAGVVAPEAGRRHLVAVLGAARLDHAETVADLHALDRVDTHQRLGDIRIEAVEDGFTPARRHAGGDDVDARTNGVAVASQGVDVVLEFAQACGLGAEERVRIGGIQVLAGQPDRAHLSQIALDTHAEALGEHPACDRTRGHPHGGLAGRRTAAAAIVAHAVFLQVGVVRVVGPEHVLDLGIVARALIGVLDDHRDRRARGHALEHARDDARLVALAALGHVARRPGLAPVEIGLQQRLVDRDARRAAVDHAADRRAVALAEGGHGEGLSPGVARHQ